MNRYKIHEPKAPFDRYPRIGDRVRIKDEFITSITKEARGTILKDLGDRWEIKWDDFSPIIYPQKYMITHE